MWSCHRHRATLALARVPCPHVAAMKTIAIFAIPCWISLAQHLHPEPSQNEKPVSLYSGLGTWTHPIRTRSAEAQKYFDQGLALFYGFNRYEALRSFRKVLELDASAAIGQWGVAMALGPHIIWT